MDKHTVFLDFGRRPLYAKHPTAQTRLSDGLSSRKRADFRSCGL
ncbi:hypothetical protein NEIELOOT_02196 [Neisseria elongata subsp. glycolytica ATCC 29315]|uniref:Uncharacterized protein n=1 Tax=Neisseria elongata subsp. glycolytica ATCC 29315 TaxID=546263 RepID=D4DSZ9_NEIEG|nr:hypothetical protein NEIELOOT_02196 [Neisseria elongata subsp. glycolytica ATCC 29315]